MNRPFRTDHVLDPFHVKDLVQARLMATACLASRTANPQPTVEALLALLQSESPLDQRMAVFALDPVGPLASDAILALHDVLNDGDAHILPFGMPAAPTSARKIAARMSAD